jgi:hypothetical protein
MEGTEKGDGTRRKQGKKERKGGRRTVRSPTVSDECMSSTSTVTARHNIESPMNLYTRSKPCVLSARPSPVRSWTRPSRPCQRFARPVRIYSLQPLIVCPLIIHILVLVRLPSSHFALVERLMRSTQPFELAAEREKRGELGRVELMEEGVEARVVVLGGGSHRAAGYRVRSMFVECSSVRLSPTTS